MSYRIRDRGRVSHFLQHRLRAKRALRLVRRNGGKGQARDAIVVDEWVCVRMLVAADDHPTS